MASIIISVVALVLAVATLAYSLKVALVYHRFNEQIRDWSKSLDEEVERSIWQVSRRMLEELDARISRREGDEDQNNEEKIIEENVEE